GAPESICIAPTDAAEAIPRAPTVQARCESRTNQGIQARPAMLFGHIRQLSVRPLNANATPATAAARRLPVQRRARQYIPIPASHWCDRQKTASDHVNGNSR